MITIRTDKGFEFARAEARKQMQSALISVVLFVTDEPTMRDYVFRGGGRQEYGPEVLNALGMGGGQ